MEPSSLPTWYEVFQKNGQRIYRPQTNLTEPNPPKGSEIFVGRIPTTIFEDELIPIFSRVGTIYEFRLMMHFSGISRGFAFVRYTSPEAADNAVKELHKFEIRPAFNLCVAKSVDNCKLFIGGLPKQKTKEEILEELNKCVEKIKNIIMYQHIGDKSKHRGYAFIEFDSHNTAATTRRKFTPRGIELWGRFFQVDWAQPEPEMDSEKLFKVSGKIIIHIFFQVDWAQPEQEMESKVICICMYIH